VRAKAHRRTGTVLLTVSGVVDPELTTRIAHDERPRPDYVAMAAAMDAELLDVTDETIRRWAEARLIAHIRLPSGQLRFRRADIDLILQPVQPEASSTPTQGALSAP